MDEYIILQVIYQIINGFLRDIPRAGVCLQHGKIH